MWVKSFSVKIGICIFIPEVTSISGIKIQMPIFTENDLTHISDAHFQINLIA